ncbi:hypothetical protein OAU81_00115 [bacterium]|nr:hypothetical protein [bacterium]
MKETKYTGTVNTDKCKKVDVTINRDSGETMSLYELARWRCLMESVSIIGEKLDRDSNSRTNWIKPIAIQKYVDERTDSMLFELANDANIEEVFDECTTS